MFVHERDTPSKNRYVIIDEYSLRKAAYRAEGRAYCRRYRGQTQLLAMADLSAEQQPFPLLWGRTLQLPVGGHCCPLRPRVRLSLCFNPDYITCIHFDIIIDQDAFTYFIFL